ncbi:hypothetical protein ERG27_11330 [Bacillus amyloliquefaciens]|nr:hypothetical protein BSO20_16890 [Bacillus amyloliquefaciens]ARB34419.1 hypothetical protein BAJT_14515 [Bacillus velezensis]ARM28965.1 hypothetical protein B9C48_14520 [Bacillus vallismortis]QJC43119.1 hypothetical protein FHJ82_14640 [Bacillus sp. HNA3]AVV95091.1 hypothetical protein DA376_14720 [Bacillus velezensis]
MSLHHGELFSLSLYMNSPAKSSHEEGRMNTGFALKMRSFFIQYSGFEMVIFVLTVRGITNRMLVIQECITFTLEQDDIHRQSRGDGSFYIVLLLRGCRTGILRHKCPFLKIVSIFGVSC